jgi:hypothetical protein
VDEQRHPEPVGEGESVLAERVVGHALVDQLVAARRLRRVAHEGVGDDQRERRQGAHGHRGQHGRALLELAPWRR